MSDFSKKYFKICGIGLGILAAAALTIFVISHYSRPQHTALTETPSPSDVVPSETAFSVIMQENRELKPSAYTPEPTPQPTQNIIFVENSHISPPPSLEPPRTPVPQKPLSPYEYECTLSITCNDILPVDENHKKADIISQNGIILEKITTGFNSGETVFDILLRVLKEQKIHIDYSQTSGSNTVYIKAIGNIYQLDFGPSSGWVYLVNGQSPAVGCAEYKLVNGDSIEWKYIR